MSWLRIRYRADRSLGEAITGALEACGAVSVTLEDAAGDAFFDAATPEDPGWEEVYVTGLFPGAVDADRIVATVGGRVGGRAGQLVKIDLLAEEDWARSWARDYQALRVSERLWVSPSWIEPPPGGVVNVVIDPGMAFGTGTHPTTQLCLQWLAQAELGGRRVVDYGCGSGILAIAAVKLGAAHAYAVDTDPHARTASRYNAERNGVSERITVTTCADAPEEPADVVIANILANVILSLHDTLCSLVRPRGRLLLAGILDSQRERITRGFAAEFEFELRRREAWCLLVGRAARD